jgi:hypothetical protein
MLFEENREAYYKFFPELLALASAHLVLLNVVGNKVSYYNY